MAWHGSESPRSRIGLGGCWRQRPPRRPRCSHSLVSSIRPVGVSQPYSRLRGRCMVLFSFPQYSTEKHGPRLVAVLRKFSTEDIMESCQGFHIHSNESAELCNASTSCVRHPGQKKREFAKGPTKRTVQHKDDKSLEDPAWTASGHGDGSVGFARSPSVQLAPNNAQYRRLAVCNMSETAGCTPPSLCASEAETP